MNIVIIIKDKLADIPPVLSVANILVDLGHNVHIITSEVPEQISLNLISKGITFEILNYSGSKSIIGKLKQYLQYRYAARKKLSHLDFDLLWVEDAHTILALGKSIKKYTYVLQISELYDEFSFLIKAIRKVISDAAVVFMPEYNRSILYQIWFGLNKRPIVLPNKPYFIPCKDEIDKIKLRYSNYFDIIRNKKVILYQGRIHSERKISGFVKAAAKLGEDYLFVIMGSDQYGMVDEYKSINPRLIHIDFIAAPDYLAITSIAYIGILSYDPMQLNTAYCAPNKIYEYGAFGIPMIGNDIPGLRVLEQKKAGTLANENDDDAILHAYNRIIENYEDYSNSSLLLYNGTNNKVIIEKAFKDINKTSYNIR